MSAYDASVTSIVLEATLTCPECEFVKTETMPTNACQFFYRCSACGTTLKPLPGDCCVFCSYSDQMCPPRQSGGSPRS